MPKLVISGGGATTASHADYINKSKGDKRLDEKIIFTSSTSGITHYKARTHLLEKKTGKEQYIKLLFSPEKGVFNKFGNTTEERLLAMEKVVQEGLGNLWKELGVKDVRWAAGTHTNTNHPHTHIIINTSVVDAVTGEPKTLPKIPRSWFWRKNNDNSVLAKLFEVPVAAHTIATPPENVLTKKPVSEVFFPAKEL
ncbi:MAG TPA: hypothetical protein VK308_02415, partial [Pyrinomonadaceae bacterium]|nr:hypothetical protein [Pyrinomonadaceae bacterium]